MLHSNIGYHFGDGNMLYCVLHGRNGGHRKNGSTMVIVCMLQERIGYHGLCGNMLYLAAPLNWVTVKG